MTGPVFETRTAAPRTALEQEIAALDPWFQNLHLPDGTQTAPCHPLGDYPRYKWLELAPHLPEDLAGWTALDVGCNAGFYSFELARRGARVTAIDSDPHYLRQAIWAARQHHLEGAVRFEELQVHDLARRGERFDLVLFLGVFYHLRYPMLALETVVRCTRQLLVFQSLTTPGEEVHPPAADLGFGQREALAHVGWPRLSFVEGQLAGDPTNWWVPNHAAVEAMLRASGVRVVVRPGREMYLCTPDPAARSSTQALDEAEYQAATGCAPTVDRR